MGERGDRSILPLSGERQAARTTIVGGQPPGQGRTLATIPNGLEHLLGMAAVDATFARSVLGDRQQALRDSGLELTAVEQAMLRAVDDAALRQMIESVDRKLAGKDRRAFLGLAAAALAGLAGAGMAGGCKPTRKDIPNAGQPVSKPKAGSGTAKGTAEGSVGAVGEGPATKPTKRPPVNRGVRPDRPRPLPKPKPKPGGAS